MAGTASSHGCLAAATTDLRRASKKITAPAALAVGTVLFLE
jgi:hypothetical protein